ncbi:hypothetical protein Hanom_Chr09g00801821 [Helianthus anomalus]
MEKLPLPTLEAHEWYQELQAAPLITLKNKELQVLLMMLRWKPGSKTKLVYKERDQGAVVTKAAKPKRPENPVTIAVKQATSGTFRPRKNKSKDYVLVSDTLEGLDVLGPSSGAGGAGVGSGLVIGQKRKVETAPTGAA